MIEHKFAHSPLFDRQRRGRVKVYCRCGVQSPLFKDTDEGHAFLLAGNAYSTHVGLKELERKQLLH